MTSEKNNTLFKRVQPPKPAKPAKPVARTTQEGETMTSENNDTPFEKVVRIRTLINRISETNAELQAYIEEINPCDYPIETAPSTIIYYLEDMAKKITGRLLTLTHLFEAYTPEELETILSYVVKMTYPIGTDATLNKHLLDNFLKIVKKEVQTDIKD